MKLFDAAAMREADRRTIEDLGLPGCVLMETAGRGAAEFVMEVLPGVQQNGVSVFCGKGNNGGDGFVIARFLQSWGIDAEVIRLYPGEDHRGDAALHMKVAERGGVPFLDLHTPKKISAYFDGLSPRRILVDALLGTGLSGPVRGLTRHVLTKMKESQCPTFAVDIPSGIHSDSGKVLGITCPAQATATFGGLKVGLVVGAGLKNAGRVKVINLGFSPKDRSELSIGRFLQASTIAACLPKRPTWGHKGTFGHLLVIAGSPGKFGAAAMTTLSALRSGVGLLTLVTPKSAINGATPLPMEVMVEVMDDDGAGVFSPEAQLAVLKMCEGKSAIAIGPGLASKPGLGDFVRRVAATTPPTVMDADALNALGVITPKTHLGSQVILTPHPGEMARLLDESVPDIQSQRIEKAMELADKTGATVLLKGASTLIVGETLGLQVNSTGNNGMGTAGAGDVLTGLIGGLLAQGLHPEEAAGAGAFVHGLAGDLMAAKKGRRSLIATDIIDGFALAFQELLGDEK